MVGGSFGWEKWPSPGILRNTAGFFWPIMTPNNNRRDLTIQDIIDKFNDSIEVVEFLRKEKHLNDHRLTLLPQ